jgi:hypothetical protein
VARAPRRLFVAGLRARGATSVGGGCGCGCLLALAVLAVAPQPAVAALQWARARAVDGAPSSAPKPASFELDSVACASPASCVAVGSYIATVPSHEQAGASGSTLPVIVAESHQQWLKPRGVALPATALRGRGQTAALEAVACPAAGSCVAIGSYVDASGEPREMVLSESRGAWTAARDLVFSPASASVELSALACRTASSCVAVGSLREAAGSSTSHPVAVSDTAGSWGAPVEVALPAGVSGAQNATFSSVACPVSGSCTAAGYYQLEAAGFNPPTDRAILAGESAGVWGAADAIALSPMLSGAGGEQLKAVACPELGACVAVGSYEDRDGDEHPLALGESRGAWGAAIPIVAPANAGAGAGTSLEAVACPSHGACEAVGQYDVRGGAVAPMAVSGSASGWGHAVEIASPHGAGSGPGLLEALLSVACPAARFCLAVGGEIAVNALAAG